MNSSIRDYISLYFMLCWKALKNIGAILKAAGTDYINGLTFIHNNLY